MNTAFATSEAMKLPEKHNKLLENFFDTLARKDFESAYTIVTPDFTENTPFQTFVLLATESGLTQIGEKKWVSFKKEMFGMVAFAEGEFVTKDGTTHIITFEILNAAHEIKIKSIQERISVKDLRKRLPASEKLQSKVEKDLRAITDFLQNEESEKLYTYLTSNQKNRIQKADIEKMITQLKKINLTVIIPKGTVITMRRKPILTKTGLMRVTGSFKNATSKVSFTLDYDYEWQWKLGNFSLKIKPLPK